MKISGDLSAFFNFTYHGLCNCCYRSENLFNSEIDKWNIFPNVAPATVLENRKWLLMILIAPFRSLTCKHADHHRALVSETYLTQMWVAGFLANQNLIDHACSWVSEVNYREICALIDMFFNKFPNHPYAEARIGTNFNRQIMLYWQLFCIWRKSLEWPSRRLQRQLSIKTLVMSLFNYWLLMKKTRTSVSAHVFSYNTWKKISHSRQAVKMSKKIKEWDNIQNLSYS